MGSIKMITVDTHIIIWDVLKPDLITQNAKKAINRAKMSDGIIFCEISLWEIAMLIKKKRIEIEISYIEFIELVCITNNYYFQGITPEIAELSTNLSTTINLDPADRLIAATSIIKSAPLITADTNLQKSESLSTIW
jgi:PIN domain nuclease of toxin-antitoxin system